MVCTLSNSLGWGSIHVRLQIFTEKLLWIFFQVRKNIYMFYEIELNLKSEALFFTKMDEVKVRITIIYKSNRLLLSKEYKLATEKNWERLVQFMNFT